MRLIDADALEKDGWMMHRNRRVDEKTMVYETKKPTEFPTIEPERKTGKWIERNPQNSDKCRLIECSECGDAYIVDFGIDYADWIEGRNFCRRCGADLR